MPHLDEIRTSKRLFAICNWGGETCDDKGFGARVETSKAVSHRSRSHAAGTQVGLPLTLWGGTSRPRKSRQSPYYRALGVFAAELNRH